MFRDRVEAGRRLAEHLTHYASRDDVVVLGVTFNSIPPAVRESRATESSSRNDA